MKYILQDNKTVIDAIRTFAEKHPKNKINPYVNFILDCYTEYPKMFSRVHIYVDEKWASDNQVTVTYDNFKSTFLFLYVSDDEAIIPDALYLRKPDFEAIKYIFYHNPLLNGVWDRFANMDFEFSNSQVSFFSILQMILRKHVESYYK